MPKGRRMSFRRKLMFTYILLIALPVILALLFSLAVTTKNMYNQTNKNMQQIMSLAVLNLEYERSKVIEISNLVHNNPTVQRILSDTSIVTYNQFQQNALLVRQEIDNIIVAGSNNKITIIYKDAAAFSGYSSEELISESAFAMAGVGNSKKEIFNQYFSSNDQTSRWEYNTDYNGNKHLVLIRKIRNSSGEYIGSVAVYYDINNISRVIRDIAIGESGFLFVVDEDGNIISHNKKDIIFTNIGDNKYVQKILSGDESYEMNIDGRDYKFAVKTVSSTLWRVVGVMPKDEFINRIWYMAMFFVFVGLVAIGLAIIASLFLAKNITIPIHGLFDAMKQVEGGNLDVKIQQNYSTDEISFLSHGFNNMIEKIKTQIKEIKEKEHAKRMVDIKVLHEQINPHFLYNTLDSINWLAASGGNNEKVSEMVSSLANMLRLGLSKGRDIITVREEMEHIKCYINIQQLRFDESFKVEYHVSDEIMDKSVIKVFLQPLIENAIIHGFMDSEYKGMIVITGSLQDDILFFTVDDNGVGKDIHELNQIINTANDGSSGYGLYNIHQRIRLYYGDSWGLKAVKSELGGVKIEVRLPQIRM